MKLLSAVFAVATVLSAADPQVSPQTATAPRAVVAAPAVAAPAVAPHAAVAPHPRVAAHPRVAPRPAVAPLPAVAPRLTIPKAAVESEPGNFHYTDAQGKKWIYRPTPFGIARFEDAPGVKPVPASDLYPGMKATADGDTIRFERPGPFGVYRWQTKQSELNEMERTVWNRQLAETAAK
jgi:hypothetical protein